MNSESAAPADVVLPAPPVAGLLPTVKSSRRWLRLVALVAAIGVVTSALLWHRLGGIQEQLARQSADAGTQAGEARVTARQAQELAIETAAKLAVMDTRISEVALQRTQLEELMQSLSRSRDENLVVDIDSAVRLAQQQAQLSGSAEPLLAALKSAELRVARAAQPRLTPVQRAMAKDVARIRATALADLPSLLVKLDELVQMAEELPVANAVAVPKAIESLKRKDAETVSNWWQRAWSVVRTELEGLVRVSRIDDPDAVLLTPEQSFFLRENLKLKLLNARLGLLSRHNDAARADLSAALVAISRFFDNSSRKTQAAQMLLQQLISQSRALELPRVDETLAALATAAAGR
ncbi:MAG: uroporphyrinogen-III C-methyltransferase [Rhodoferax sp.]|nr:uroporphyrinogen-III C-methyltransferase [Rhodoferax sp.]